MFIDSLSKQFHLYIVNILSANCHSRISTCIRNNGLPYKNEKVAAMLRLGCSYFAAIRYVCDNWWPQSSQLERLVACLQQPCSFYQPLLAHRAASGSQLGLAAVT